MHSFHHLIHALHHRAGHHFGRHGHRDHHSRHAGFGDDGGFPGGPGAGLGGFERGRKLGANDLQLLILALLAQQASHGYELIKAIDQRSHGYYVPSPGMIYPALSYLEEVGYASVEPDGAKKRYSITVAGLAQVDEHRAAIDAMWQQLSSFGERMAQLRADPAASDAAPARGRHAHGDELHAAFGALALAVRERGRADPQERQRIAAILGEAIAAIRAGGHA